MKASYLCLMIITVLTLAAQEQIEILIPYYPPLSETDGSGLWCDIVEKAFESQGETVKFTNLPLERMNKQIESGISVGQINSLWSIAGDRKDFYTINEKAMINTDVGAFYSLFREKTRDGIRSIEELQQLSVGAIAGTGSINVLTDKEVNFEKSPNVDSVILKLVNHRIDAAVLGDLTGYYGLKEYYDGYLEDWGYMSIYTSPISIVFSNNHSDAERVENLFYLGLTEIVTNGIYLEILESYYPEGLLNWNIVPEWIKTLIFE